MSFEPWEEPVPVQRIFFVGVHNKEGMEPLDSRSKSGRLIDRAIAAIRSEAIPDAEFIKTNMFHPSVTWLPCVNDPQATSFNWVTRNEVNVDSDIIITLGKIVGQTFSQAKVPVIQVAHPGRIWSAMRQEEYIKNIVESVKKFIGGVPNY